MGNKRTETHPFSTVRLSTALDMSFLSPSKDLLMRHSCRQLALQLNLEVNTESDPEYRLC